jgi:hypothetical protein
MPCKGEGLPSIADSAGDAAPFTARLPGLDFQEPLGIGMFGGNVSRFGVHMGRMARCSSLAMRRDLQINHTSTCKLSQ